MKALIAGAGIGGLTAALALVRRGIDVEIYERADELREIGAGITLQANAMRAYGELGIADRLAAAGAVVESTALLEDRGRVLNRASIVELCKELGAPVVAI